MSWGADEMGKCSLAAILIILGATVFAQEEGAGILTQGESPIGSEAVPEAEEELLPDAEAGALEPIFPIESNALVVVEAEDAVSTNFAREPTLNYGASGSRTLHLNRYTDLYGGSAFFAEYVVFVEEAGSYALWYGGSPPGPREDVFPSYSSPFTYRIDDRAPVAVYREDVRVAEGYIPSFYWIEVGTVELESGLHILRFEVAEKRRFDGKYYFLLDSIFLVDLQQFDSSHPTPDAFPTNLESTDEISIFGSINDSQYLLTQTPDDEQLYIEFSLIYSLIGDYNSAIKNLNRAALISPSDPEIQRLLGKNRLWKGEATEGLRAYERLLQLDTERPDGFAEAGKVAAWIGRYRDSVQFFRSGIRAFPEDLSLLVNLGITYLWSNQADQAYELFDEAEALAFADAELIPRLGEIYLVNGYPDLAIDTFRRAIREYPEHLAIYLQLERAYSDIGRTDDAEEVHAQIAERFVASDRLESYLDTFETKRTMKDSVIEGYQNDLASDPDNLDLRDILVQTYFWNGLREEAI
jgi:tetratricopeptide (TPR) repeat protein